MTSLALLDPGTGEVVQAVDAAALLRAAGITDVRDSEPEQLAAFDDAAKTLKSITDEARGLVSDELVRRRDMEVSGTLTTGGYKIVVPSRSAGTTAYDRERTPVVLAELVKAKLISEKAAREACPDVTPAATVPWELLHEIVDVLDGEVDMAAEDDVRERVLAIVASRPEATYRPVTAKLDALCKIGGPVADAIGACKVDIEPPRRKATITQMPR